jgi:DNA-binding XRE family transcriptional regulator
MGSMHSDLGVGLPGSGADRGELGLPDVKVSGRQSVPLILTLAERMLIVRRRLGMSQTDLGKLMRTSRYTILRIEREQRPFATVKTQGQWRQLRERFQLVEHRYKADLLAANARADGMRKGGQGK